ncbi:type IV pilus twitching motility protein PilT [Desulfurivibrio dismutans]|uniref:type IV pilus twitching motility protein PilT n=1 Tax=Desulfurivibrio dismutans TaxID=1398908 RepID=UPI0023DC3F2A|nr:PilT/PilU family type 4a pilus ATPase [Desulfurivibrio alkaliphilus]MDF1613418.1 PilT/PilU family type 4a pilus ATPase [Desulfurivibrio alkaliphilus]
MKEAEINYWISSMLESFDNASDLNVTVNRPLQVESSGRLTPAAVTPPVEELTPFQTEVFALNLIKKNKRLLNELIERGSCDLSHELDAKARFRVNVFFRQGHLTTVLRRLSTEVPTIEQLGLPDSLKKINIDRTGFILVTGATGTGKSTTLAALLDMFNNERPEHIVTLEDPIEFVHQHKKATFNQRELGTDFDDFASGLRAALRQAPKIILVGEMRDRVSMEIGLTAAETGHLVLSTLHTIDAGQTINRILGMFEHHEQGQIRNRLADTLRWVVSQRLLPKVGDGRVAALEIMGTSLRVRELILNGEQEDKTYYDVISDARAAGWQTFDQHILDLYEQGLITEKTAVAYASRRTTINRGLDQIKAAKGEETSKIKDLSMEENEAQPGRRRR